MPSFEAEVHKKSGVLIREIPKDGKYRSFKVGGAEWFAIAFDDCGTFGCLGKKELYGWNGGRAWQLQYPQEDPQLSRGRIDEERQIIAIGNALMDSGQTMSDTDFDRYILALGRVMKFNGRQKR